MTPPMAATRFPWGRAVYYALAELAGERGDLPAALDFVERSLAANAWNTRALDLRAALLRRRGRTGEAAASACAAHVLDPLDAWAANELYLLAGVQQRLGRRMPAYAERTIARRGDAYLELAVGYADAGLLDEALDVLERAAGSPDSTLSDHPLVHYYLGYYAGQRGETERAHLHYAQARRLPLDDSFPFQVEAVAALEAALDAEPNDASVARVHPGQLPVRPGPRTGDRGLGTGERR